MVHYTREEGQELYLKVKEQKNVFSIVSILVYVLESIIEFVLSHLEKLHHVIIKVLIVEDVGEPRVLRTVV